MDAEECLQMPKANLNRSVAVFVFEEFTGPAFEYISGTSDTLYVLRPMTTMW